MQPDLFLAPPPALDMGEIDRCGLCIHRNAAVDAEEGDCSPMGRRRRDDPPCAWAFSRRQLVLSLAKRPKGT